MTTEEMFQTTCLPIFDSDMMIESVQGCNFVHRQLHKGAFYGKLYSLKLPRACIDYGSYNLDVAVRGETSKKSYLVGMLLGVVQEARFFKAKVDSGDLLFASPGSKLDVLHGIQPWWCFISFDKETFEDACRKRIEGQTFAQYAQQRAIINSNPATIRLVQLARYILFVCRQKQLCAGQLQARQRLANDLLESCIDTIFGRHYSLVIEKTTKRAQLVELAEEYLYGIDANQVKVSELAHNLSVSIRTLEYAFKEVFGITPKRYLMIRRLNFVRQKLLREPNKTITHHATQHGFWHMAQFSADYKDFFGEAPSETLKKIKVSEKKRRCNGQPISS
ncbi:MAG: helix-turn-helix domain-containing protein [Desulfuromonadales bacterium]|nr:helix-turn-helix domain-containing protein [Desulfuromonadales bacterium]